MIATLAAGIRREPVWIGTAVSLTADGVVLWAGAPPATQGILHGIVLAWVAVFVRSLSTPTVKADEAVDAVKDEAAVKVADAHAEVAEVKAAVAEQVETARYVGAVEHQALAAAGQAAKLDRASKRR